MGVFAFKTKSRKEIIKMQEFYNNFSHKDIVNLNLEKFI